MHPYSSLGMMSRFAAFLLLALMASLVGVPAHAVDNSYVEVNIGFRDTAYVITPVGSTQHLDIRFTNSGPNSIRATSLQCNQNGTSLRASSISRLPNSMVFAPGASFQTEQIYQAVSAGTTFINCTLKYTDLATGTNLVNTSTSTFLNINDEPTLYVRAASSSQTATVGQAIFLQVLYGNHGKGTLTNIQVACGELGRGVAFVSQRQNMTTLRSIESGFAEIRMVGLFPGASALVLCQVGATDSSTNETIYESVGTNITIR